MKTRFDPNKVPEGYEVDADMFGSPFLRPKYTPLENKLSAAFGCIFLLGLVALVIWGAVAILRN